MASVHDPLFSLHHMPNWIAIFPCPIYMNHLLANLLNYITWMRKFSALTWLFPIQYTHLMSGQAFANHTWCLTWIWTIWHYKHGFVQLTHPRNVSYNFDSLLFTYHMVGMEGFGMFATNFYQFDTKGCLSITHGVYTEIEYRIILPFLLYPCR